MRIAYLWFSFGLGSAFCRAHGLSLGAQSEAELDVGFQLTSMNAVLLAVCRSVELKQTELYGALW